MQKRKLFSLLLLLVLVVNQQAVAADDQSDLSDSNRGLSHFFANVKKSELEKMGEAIYARRARLESKTESQGIFVQPKVHVLAKIPCIGHCLVRCKLIGLPIVVPQD